MATSASKPRAQALLENYDDVITGLMNQMDQYAKQSGGYINRMHPDQFAQDGTRKEIAEGTRVTKGQRRNRSRR